MRLRPGGIAKARAELNGELDAWLKRNDDDEDKFVWKVKPETVEADTREWMLTISWSFSRVCDLEHNHGIKNWKVDQLGNICQCLSFVLVWSWSLTTSHFNHMARWTTQVERNPDLPTRNFVFTRSSSKRIWKGSLNDEQPLIPSFSPPSSYWSSDEKDLFFHGLAVYSRFWPDLIAESV